MKAATENLTLKHLEDLNPSQAGFRIAEILGMDLNAYGL